MKKLLKTRIKAVIKCLAQLFISLLGGKYIIQVVLESALGNSVSVCHGNVTMLFVTPNPLCHYRASSFSSKEPGTLEWIDAIPTGSVMWDIGANIGLYSIYAAKNRNVKVLAFEPSVFNLELLARNIFLNQLQNEVIIVPVALTSQTGPNLFHMSNTQWGGALSTFGENYGQDGKDLASLFEYQIYGICIDDLQSTLGITPPKYIKIDVDGIEHLILTGGASVLKGVESIFIEINDNFAEQSEQSSKLLRQAGLMLYRKCDRAGNQYNQWWVRSSDSRKEC